MKLCSLIILLLPVLLVSCFLKKEEVPEEKNVPRKVSKTLSEEKRGEAQKDRTLDLLSRYLIEADGIHREAWWVLNAVRPPVGKSPFGKVQRAFLSSQNIKLTNKSLFRCDRYLVKRDVMGMFGYPQKGEVFEKCSEKSEAKRIASFEVPREGEVLLTFYPENLQEVLGLGAGVLNRTIHCTLKGGDKLESLSCKDWAQDRTAEQMIRLDVYDYQKSGKNMIRLRGKVYQHLSDIRKIEADVPMEGKIIVTETELYAPEPKVSPSPVASPVEEALNPGLPAEVPARAPVPVPGGVVPPARDQVDPDVMMQRQQGQDSSPGESEAIPEYDPSMEGWPDGVEAPVGEPSEPLPQEAAPVEVQPFENQGEPHGR